MMQSPQATASLKTKVVRKPLPLEKSQLLQKTVAVAPVSKIGSNINNGSQMISSLLQSSSTLDQSVATSSLSNLQTASLLASTSNSEKSNSTLMSGVIPSDNLLQHILTGSLTAKAVTKPSVSPTGNAKPGEPMVIAPKVKPVLPDGLPELLLSKITLLEMVCTYIDCIQNTLIHI